MTSILQTLCDAIQEDFGRPARLSRLLGENGSECGIQLEPPRRGIGCGGVVHVGMSSASRTTASGQGASAAR